MSVPPNPRLPQIGATMFGAFALGFVVTTFVHLGHGDTGLDRTSTVLLYAGSPVLFLVIGALACVLVRPDTYQRWMGAFLVAVIVWIVCGGTALLRVDRDDSFLVMLHLLVAGIGALTLPLVRGVARQRGLTQ